MAHNVFRRRMEWLVTSALLLLTLTTVMALPTQHIGVALAQDNGTVGLGEFSGRVTDSAYGRAFVGAKVLVENKAGYIDQVVIGPSGRFYFRLPPSTYNVTIAFGNTMLDRFVVTVSANSRIFHSVDLNYTLVSDATVYGYVYGSSGDLIRKSLRINFTSTSTPYWNETLSDFNGRYEMTLPRGIYNITVYDRDKVIYKGEGVVGTGVQAMNLTLEKGLEPFTLSHMLTFFVENWYYVLAVILALVVLIFIYGYLVTFLKSIGERYSTHFSQDVWTLISRTVKVVYAFVSTYALIYLTGLISGVSTTPWFQYTMLWYNALFFLFILFLIGRIIMIIINNFVEKLRQRKVPRTTTLLVRLALKYLTLVMLLAIATVVLLSALGMYEIIYAGMLSFFSENMGYLTLIAILIALAYLSSRFIRTFIQDLKQRETRYSSEMIDTAGKGITFTVYFIIAMIVIFTLLSMARMQEIGSTLLIILSTMLGLVVAMAATGSIGNILSGLVIQSMKPYEKGDRISIGQDIMGDVEDTTLAFTTIRTLRNERVIVPNNYVLGAEITNLTRSGVVGIELKLSIGYDVPPERVVALIKRGTVSTKGVLKDPRPQVLAVDFKDYAVEYLVRAYTRNIKSIPAIRSRLIINIHEAFYSKGVEILSPWYLVRRGEERPMAGDVAERYKRAQMEFGEDRDPTLESGEVARAMSMFDKFEEGNQDDKGGG